MTAGAPVLVSGVVRRCDTTEQAQEAAQQLQGNGYTGVRVEGTSVLATITVSEEFREAVLRGTRTAFSMGCRVVVP